MTETPPLPLKPAVAAPNPYQQSAMSGRSPADMHNEGNPIIPNETTGTDRASFGQELLAAQGRDSGKTPAVAREVSVPTPVSAQSNPLAPPKVPTLPQAEEWRPKGEKAGQQWDALKSKHAEELTRIQTERDIAKKELEAAKLSGSPDYEMTKKQRDEYRELLRDVAIERDPEFKQRFSAKESAAIEAAKMASGENSEKMEKLLKMPNSPWRDEQLNKLIDDMPASSQRRVNAALQLLEQVDVERSAEIASRRTNFDAKQSALMQQTSAQRAEQEKAMLGAFDGVTQQWDKHPFFAPKEGDAAHAERVANTKALAKSIYAGQHSPEELANAAHWAASGEMIMNGWIEATKRAEAAEAALDKIRGVQPGDGRPGSAAGEEDHAQAPQVGTAEYLRYMNAGIKTAQATDMQRRRGR